MNTHSETAAAPTISTQEEGVSLKQQLVDLAERAQVVSPEHPSRLDVTVRALQLYLSVFDKEYVGDIPPLPFVQRGEIGTPKKLMQAARDMGDYGFTLDELITIAGPEAIMHPRSYKLALSKLLRAAGFSRKQMRRDGTRPLVWFAPPLEGMDTE